MIDMDEEIFDTEQIAESPAETMPEDTLTLKYMGEERSVGRGEAVELAQKGLDYDRIRGKYERLKTTAAMEGPEAVRRAADIDAFLDDFPDVDPGTIPEQVWEEVKAGRSLSAAYARHENRALRVRVDELAAGEAGRSRTTGARSGPGRTPETDEFVRYLMD